MMPGAFEDREREFARRHRRARLFHSLVLALIAWMVALTFAAIALGVAVAVRLGPDGLAAQAGRLTGVFERSWSREAGR